MEVDPTHFKRGAETSCVGIPSKRRNKNHHHPDIQETSGAWSGGGLELKNTKTNSNTGQPEVENLGPADDEWTNTKL